MRAVSLNGFSLVTSLQRAFIAVLSFALLAGCGAEDGQKIGGEAPPTGGPTINTLKAPQTITIMSYNAENLFDTQHDVVDGVDKHDWINLPMADKLGKHKKDIAEYCPTISNDRYRKSCFEKDWSQEALDQKIQNYASIIKLATESGSPDIVVFQEVENINALNQLVNKGLANEGYSEIILIEGPDRRGIDVAIISKIPQAPETEAILHNIDLTVVDPDARPTRGILEATFLKGNTKFKVLANHWPSQGNPDEKRMVAAETMWKISAESDIPVIATGDFNTVNDDELNGIEEWVVNKTLNPYFLNAETEYFETLGLKGHRGTYNYRGKWQSLDHIFFLENKILRCDNKNAACFEPLWDSYRVFFKPFMFTDIPFTTPDGTRGVNRVPYRFNQGLGQGFSDHLPAIVEVKIR